MYLWLPISVMQGESYKRKRLVGKDSMHENGNFQPSTFNLVGLVCSGILKRFTMFLENFKSIHICYSIHISISNLYYGQLKAAFYACVMVILEENKPDISSNEECNEPEDPDEHIPNGLMAQERRLCDAYKTKLARSQRKLARQKSLTRNSSSATNSTQLDTRRLVLNAQTNLQDNKPTSSISSDLFKFCTPDNKKLRLLLTKDLKNSDVGSLGRIVLPKREVEENLPVLSDKEGIRIVIRDVYSSKEWNLKFKYWSNNKSRMYVLENTGDFVKQNRLETGDSLTLYEDENKNLYFSIKKVEKPAADMNNNPHIPHTYEARDEEEASLALLIEQLKHQEQQEEAHSLSTLSLGASFSYGHGEKAKHSASSNYVTGVSNVLQPTAAAMQQSSSPTSKMRVVDDHHIDDWLHFPWQSP